MTEHIEDKKKIEEDDDLDEAINYLDLE